MTWIFGSFQVTPCALTSCHAVIGKQGDDSASGQSGPHRCITRRRSRDENHVVRFRQCRESESSVRRAADQCVSDGTACKEVQTLAPPGSQKKIWEEVFSLSICLSIYHSTNNKLWALFENKMRGIFFYKQVIFFRSLSVIMFLDGSTRLYNKQNSRLNFFFSRLTW